MPSKSRRTERNREERLSAQGKPLAFRGFRPVCADNFGDPRHRNQADRPRKGPLRRLLLSVLPGGPVRSKLADVPGSRLILPIVSEAGRFFETRRGGPRHIKRAL